MRAVRNSLLYTLCLLIATGPMISGAAPDDLWIHPRGEAFDPERHYKDDGGELYYKAENDIRGALGTVKLERAGEPLVTVGLGPELREQAERSGATLAPVLHYDTDGDGIVDATVAGRIEDAKAVFDSPKLVGVDLRASYWQIGVKYKAGTTGDPALDRRYLASVDSKTARVAWRRLDELEQLPAVAAGPVPAGLVILKHRPDTPFDFANFVENPGRYAEDFDSLTREADADDWTVDGSSSQVTSHFEEEDLFIVRTTPGLALEVEWGDMPIAAFMTEYLAVRPDGDGCYNSQKATLAHADGSPVEVPHRVLYCPNEELAVFDAPDGYEIAVTALAQRDVVEEAEIGTSIRDNLKLYAKEIWPRSPSSRSTGAIAGNVRAGFADAGADLGDAFGHVVTGTYRRNKHTGQEKYRPSLLTALPVALYRLGSVDVKGAFDGLLDGVTSGVEVIADATSAANNAVVNPLVQVTVGSVSIGAADTTGTAIGTLTQAVAKNLPLAERSLDSVSPIANWQHDRAFAPPEHTRTDTQLNIDRFFAVFDAIALNAIRLHNDDSRDAVRGSGDGGAGGGVAPPPPPPGGGGGGVPPLPVCPGGVD